MEWVEAGDAQVARAEVGEDGLMMRITHQAIARLCRQDNREEGEEEGEEEEAVDAAEA